MIKVKKKSQYWMTLRLGKIEWHVIFSIPLSDFAIIITNKDIPGNYYTLKYFKNYDEESCCHHQHI